MLFLENRLLSYFEEEINHLFAICQNDEEAALLRHTLSKMSIVDHTQLSYGLRAMAEHAEELAKQYGGLAVVAMAYDSGADGSQLVLQMLKPLLQRGAPIELFNSVPSYLRKMKEHPNFLLVDDFSGTGSTILNRVTHIDKDAKSRGIKLNRSVCLVAAMEDAVSNIERSGVEVKAFKRIKAGLSGYFQGDELEAMQARMLRLESELNPKIGDKDLPSFGHGKAEALYFVHPGNAPNSNFPIFWWPENSSGASRLTLMKRYEL